MLAFARVINYNKKMRGLGRGALSQGRRPAAAAAKTEERVLVRREEDQDDDKNDVEEICQQGIGQLYLFRSADDGGGLGNLYDPLEAGGGLPGLDGGQLGGRGAVRFCDEQIVRIPEPGPDAEAALERIRRIRGGQGGYGSFYDGSDDRDGRRVPLE